MYSLAYAYPRTLVTDKAFSVASWRERAAGVERPASRHQADWLTSHLHEKT